MAEVHPLAQAGHRVQLGDGDRTISQAGCMLTCLTMASNAFNNASFGVEKVNDMLRDARCFAGSSLLTEKAIPKLGMKGRRDRCSAKAVIAALEIGQLVMLGVDYKPGRSSGFSEADHFILAVKVLEPPEHAKQVLVVDAATGTEMTLEVTDDDRLQRAVSPRCLWKATEAFFLQPAGA